MGLTDLFFRRSESRWMNQEPPPYGYGGQSPRTEMRVIMCCNKCEEKVREEIAEVYGVQEAFTDQARSEVVVFGFADTHDLLRKARKVDKRAEILSTDSFTLHHNKLGHKHNNIHHKHKHSYRSNDLYGHNHNHGHGIRSGTHSSYPIETVGSPRYNSSFHQASSGYGSRYNRAGSINTSGYDDYRHRQSGYVRPELEYRHLRDGYRSEPDRYQYGEYRPQYLETRSVYDEYRPDRYGYSGYRPSQSYPPRYDEHDYRDSLYPEAMMNPEYLKQMDVY